MTRIDPTAAVLTEFIEHVSHACLGDGESLGAIADEAVALGGRAGQLPADGAGHGED